jgi:hypothetical protein
MFSIMSNQKASQLCSVLFNRSLVRPLILICLIVLFGIILPVWSGLTPNATAWFTNDLFQNADFETGTVGQPPPSPWTTSPSGPAVIATGVNRTPGGTKALRFNGNGANIDLKQRVNGVTANQRYYLGSFGTLDSGAPGGAVGLAYGWGANNYPPPNYQNCGFSYANWNGTVASFDLLSCDFVVPAGYNYVAPKMSFNAPAPHWGVTDDWYLAAVPNKTTSRYVDTRDPNILRAWGTTSGQNGESGLIILDFGQPWYDAASNSYGTLSFADNNFISIATIKILVQNFLTGYASTSGPWVGVVVGTNNYGPYVTQAHGQAWSQMVIDLQSWVQQQGYGPRENVVGGNDIEMGWSQPGPVYNWITGWQSVSGYRAYYDFGDAAGMSFDVWYYDSNGVGHAGCPTCGQNPTNGWLENDVWNVAWGTSAASPFPEIYRTDGVNASQWYRLSRTHLSWPMIFQGTLTEQVACSQRGCPKFCPYSYCASTNNSPGMGWGQLSQFLNFDQSVYRAVNNSSDIRWTR